MHDDFSEEETAARRDAVLKHMLNTAPKPITKSRQGQSRKKVVSDQPDPDQGRPDQDV